MQIVYTLEIKRCYVTIYMYIKYSHKHNNVIYKMNKKHYIFQKYEKRKFPY